MATQRNEHETRHCDQPEPPFLWELRPDLEILHQTDDDGGIWVLRDPFRLAYFRTTSSGLQFLQWLGRGSLTPLVTRLQRDFPDEEIDVGSLKNLAMAAVSAGVLRPLLPGLMPLQHAARAGAIQQLLRMPLRFLSFRWRGIDPQPLLRLFYPLVLPLLRRSALAAGLLLMLSACVLVLLRMDQLLAELPSLSSLLDWRTAATFAVAFAVVRVLHEFGHAIVCHHFGGECHELGFLFVCGIPILYCDVSDSWRESNPQRRMAVAGAGIAAELIVAAVCGVLWCVSDSGLLHAFFLQTMLLASLNTILVNGNPLVRFDGYFMVSDLLNKPNLWNEGRIAAADLLQRLVFGETQIRSRGNDWRAATLLSLYGVAAWCYSVMVLAGLLLFVASLLEPIGLESLAILPAIAVGLEGAGSLIRYGKNSTRAWRAALGLLVLSATVLLLLFVPVSLPLRVPGVLGSGDAVPIFTTVPGRLLRCVRPGTALKQGDVVAEFANPELELGLAQAEGEVQRREAELEGLQVRLLNSSLDREAMPVIAEALATARTRVQTLRRQTEQLIIRSPRDGRLLPPRNQQTAPRLNDFSPALQQPVLRPDEAGVWIEAQVQLGWVGSSTDIRFEACVEEQVVKRLEIGSQATVRPACMTLQSLPGEVERIDQTPMISPPRELLISELLPVATAVEMPGGTRLLYQVNLRPLPGTTWPELPLYAPGIAHIDTPPLSLAKRGWNLLRQTFSLLR